MEFFDRINDGAIEFIEKWMHILNIQLLLGDSLSWSVW